MGCAVNFENDFLMKYLDHTSLYDVTLVIVIQG